MRPLAIRTLAEAAEEADPAERALLWALAHGAGGDGAAMAAALSSVELPDDPYATWVRAEAARQSGEPRRARDLATEAVDNDPFFAAAYLTRASAHIALGTPNEGLRDLEHLRRTFGDNPVYADWIAALSRRLR
jgi:predicted Zn-dependent protease